VSEKHASGLTAKSLGAKGRGVVEFVSDAPTNLLHDAGFPLGEGDVPTRLVADKLDLNLATLAAALVIVVIIIVVGSALALALDTATLGSGGAVAVGIVEIAGRRLVVLVCNVGHCLFWVLPLWE
jgi:hypothetical protein